MKNKKLEQIKKNWEFRKDVRGHIEGVDVDWLIELSGKLQSIEYEWRNGTDETLEETLENTFN